MNTKTFFFFLQKNKLCYLQQKCASTDLVCLSPLKDISLIKDLRSFYMGNIMCKVNKLRTKYEDFTFDKEMSYSFLNALMIISTNFGVYSGGVMC